MDLVDFNFTIFVLAVFVVDVVVDFVDVDVVVDFVHVDVDDDVLTRSSQTNHFCSSFLTRTVLDTKILSDVM